MKKIISLSMIVLGMIAFSGCGQNDTANNNSSNNNPDEQVSKESNKNTNDSAVSIDIVAPGEYLVGTDIQPGSYYAILTDMQYGDDDSDQRAYVAIHPNKGKTTDSSNGSDSNNYSTMFRDVGQKHRYILKDGDTVTFSDNWDPKSWEVKLLNESDFRAYTKNNK